MTADPCALLDVNLLVALAWPNHVHHRAARNWFKRHSRAGWATTPLTETGFIRVSSNSRVIPAAASPATAIRVLARLCKLPGHQFWADAARLIEAPFNLSRMATSRQVTDTHLLLVAASHGGRLTTFDRGLPEVLAASDRGLVAVLS